MCDKRSEHRLVQSLYGRAHLPLQIEHDHFVAPLRHPRSRSVKRLLWTNIPDAAKGMAVQPKLTLRKLARIEESIAHSVEIEAGAVETSTIARILRELQPGHVLHGQRIDLPTCKLVAIKRHLLCNTSTLAADSFAEVDAACVLHQNIQTRIAAGCRERKT